MKAVLTSQVNVLGASWKPAFCEPQVTWGDGAIEDKKMQ